MVVKFSLNRTVPVSECPWLDADLPKGLVVYRFDGHTYGCIGPTGLAVSNEPNHGPFFEVPVKALDRFISEPSP